MSFTRCGTDGSSRARPTPRSSSSCRCTRCAACVLRPPRHAAQARTTVKPTSVFQGAAAVFMPVIPAHAKRLPKPCASQLAVAASHPSQAAAAAQAPRRAEGGGAVCQLRRGDRSGPAAGALHVPVAAGVWNCFGRSANPRDAPHAVAAARAPGLRSQRVAGCMRISKSYRWARSTPTEAARGMTCHSRKQNSQTRRSVTRSTR